jgi:hypothetical protein
MNNTEVMEFTDKVVRDGAFEDLRKNGDEFERQVVRFSGCERVYQDGIQAGELVWYERGKIPQERPVYRSTWSLAYPRS